VSAYDRLDLEYLMASAPTPRSGRTLVLTWGRRWRRACPPANAPPPAVRRRERTRRGAPLRPRARSPPPRRPSGPHRPIDGALHTPDMLARLLDEAPAHPPTCSPASSTTPPCIPRLAPPPHRRRPHACSGCRHLSASASRCARVRRRYATTPRLNPRARSSNSSPQPLSPIGTALALCRPHPEEPPMPMCPPRGPTRRRRTHVSCVIGFGARCSSAPRWASARRWALAGASSSCGRGGPSASRWGAAWAAPPARRWDRETPRTCPGRRRGGSRACRGMRGASSMARVGRIGEGRVPRRGGSRAWAGCRATPSGMAGCHPEEDIGCRRGGAPARAGVGRGLPLILSITQPPRIRASLPPSWAAPPFAAVRA